MDEPLLLHQRIHKTSHFQVSLSDASAGNGYPENGHGAALATFGPQGVSVSTAWDDNATIDQDVEIAVTGYGPPSEAFDHLKPVANGEIAVGTAGVAIGSVIMADLVVLPMAEGRYMVTVFTDTMAPFAARRVRFHLMRL